MLAGESVCLGLPESFIEKLVRTAGLEPARLAALPPQSSASAIPPRAHGLQNEPTFLPLSKV